MASLLVGLLGTWLGAPAAAELRPVQTIPLEGVEGRFDHFGIDVKGNRLFVAALGNDSVEVLDLNTGQRSTSIRGLREPQGIAVIPASDKLVVASGSDGKCRIYDRSLRLLHTIDDLDDADNVRYDTRARHIYVGYGAGALAVIDPESGKKVGEVKLEGHPESFQLEADGSRIFVNVPAAHHVAVVDRQQHAVITKWPVKEATANFPMALDEAHHRLFIGCRKPAKLLVLETKTGTVVTSLPCCGDTDDLFYDAANGHIYVAGGEGCVNVFEQTDPDRYRLLETVKTASGARTAFFAPSTGRLYVAVPHRGNQTAEIRVFEASPK